MNQYIKEVKEEYQRMYDYFKDFDKWELDMEKVEETIIYIIAKEYALTCNQVKKMINQ